MRHSRKFTLTHLVFITSLSFITKGIIDLLQSSNLEGAPEGSVNIKPDLYSSADNRGQLKTDGSIHKDVIYSHQQQQQHDELTLPKWVEDYMSWHARMRLKFPGKDIITNPNAPPVLVRYCLTSKYGGLHDRLGQLPLDLYLANQTKRVLLIKWTKPHPLEEFLIPPENGLDWTFPDGIHNLTDCVPRIIAKNFRKRVPQLESNVVHKTYPPPKFEDLIDNNIKELNYGKFNATKLIRYVILGHLNEEYLEEKLIALGEKDMIHHTPSFGAIFRRFFQPHPTVQNQIDQATKDLGLIRGEYSIAHSRVCHPKAYNRGENFDGEPVSQADANGLPFKGRAKDLALGVAARAIKCAASLPDVSKFPIYFIADSNDLVRYMTRDLLNRTYLLNHSDWFTDPKSANTTAKDLISKYNVVARDYYQPYVHLDKTTRRPVEEYYATFVDLYLTMNARCVSYGIGYYASFGAKLSGTHCKIRYAKETWEIKPVLHEMKTEYCNISDVD